MISAEDLEILHKTHPNITVTRDEIVEQLGHAICKCITSKVDELGGATSAEIEQALLKTHSAIAVFAASPG